MKKFNVARASFRTEKIDFVLEKYYKDESKQNSNSYFVNNQPQKYSKYPVFVTNKGLASVFLSFGTKFTTISIKSRLLKGLSSS